MTILRKLTKLMPILSVALFGHAALAQEDAPPQIEGNKGVPGLLAEIDRLEGELAATQDELAETEETLAVTQAELADTVAVLGETLEDLEDANLLVDATLEELLQEQNRYRVPRTGQSQCWGAPSRDPDEPHSPTSCTSTGQDGEHQAGLAPPANRFVDNGDGSVTDRFTRLVWLKKADCFTVDWETAAELAGVFSGNATVPLCNLTDDSHLGDWRLPNVFELASLLDYSSPQHNLPSLPANHPFTGLNGYYWTSTTYALDSSTDVAGLIYACRRQGYGDNRLRFNDAYVVNVNTAEILRVPKEAAEDINKRHSIGSGGSCTGQGFTSGSPADGPNAFPEPNFIVVRDAVEE